MRHDSCLFLTWGFWGLSLNICCRIGTLIISRAPKINLLEVKHTHYFILWSRMKNSFCVIVQKWNSCRLIFVPYSIENLIHDSTLLTVSFSYLFPCGSEFRCCRRCSSDAILFVSTGASGDRPKAVSEFRFASLFGDSFSIFSFEFVIGLVWFNLPTSMDEFGFIFGILRTALRWNTSRCITWVANDLMEGSAPQSDRGSQVIVVWPLPVELLNVLNVSSLRSR